MRLTREAMREVFKDIPWLAAGGTEVTVGPQRAEGQDEFGLPRYGTLMDAARSNAADRTGTSQMNLRRLKYFVKIVDIGSLTQAADVLHIAQPALSQQLATLEGEVRQQLLLRTKRGVTPTEAGKVLYRHAQLILRQCEQARVDMDAAGRGVSGAVSVGLAPGTAAASLSLPLLRT